MRSRPRTRPVRDLLSLCSTTAAVSGLSLLAACAWVAPGAPLARRGDEIMVCGQLFHTGTPVVLFNDPGGYDAYRTLPRFGPPQPDTLEKARYGQRRNLPDDISARVEARGWSLDDLRQVVHLFVLHYDAAGLSRQCFKILQDKRNLSVHFMLDVDGTIYQTLDLKERAWHATIANDHSIGIEIAHPGAYPQPGHPAMRRWYGEDWRGPFMKYPAFLGETGVRTRDFLPRPARRELREGVINGRRMFQRDYTQEQYEALAHLTAALSRVFPKLALRYPTADDGSVRNRQLSAAALRRHDGLVGHFHVQQNKQDPGPAFDWDLLIERARELRR